MIPFIDLKSQQDRIKDKIQMRFNQLLEHGQYIMGPEIQEMEKLLADFIGVKHCVGVSSGTDALLMALMALNIGPGDEVIVPDFSFFGTCEVIELLGAKTVCIDVDYDTCNMDPLKLESAITASTKAIIPVSLYGQPADFDKINEIAKRHSIPVIEDGAQSFGAIYKSKRSLALTEIGCTSFFPSKPLGCYGDGGAIFTNNDEYAQKMRELRVHGQSKRYLHSHIGLNARLDSLQAGIICEKMTIFDDEFNRRQEIAERYNKLLKGVVDYPKVLDFNKSIYAQYTIKVEKRSYIQEGLNAAGIPTTIHYPIPLSKQPALSHLNLMETNPISEKLSHMVLSIPFHPYMDEKTQTKICDTLKSLVDS